ncbi:MAG: sterol desaturase family protein [bacterium]|nr:sterol desaturase family protein [bacterium]
MGKQKISQEAHTPQLFSRGWMDRLSHVHPLLPVGIFVPLAGWFFYRAVVDEQVGGGLVAGLVLGGLLFWTLVEYVEHRFLLHFETQSAFVRRVLYITHGVHHEFPKDPKRLAIAPVVSLPLSACFYGGFVLVLGMAADPFFAGFLVGYLWYEGTHYATHHMPMRSRLGAWLKRQHMRHHFQDSDYGFGISSPLWDWVFRTQRPGVERDEVNSVG